MKKVFDLAVSSIIFAYKDFFSPVTKFFKYLGNTMQKEEMANTVSQLNLQLFKFNKHIKELKLLQKHKNTQELELIILKLEDSRDYLKGYIERHFPEYLNNIKNFPISE